ncbi:DUF2924 domain-containing protein [Victivallis vadensis]|jgi:hypothetical protein|uniref:DUF2924 domain-containing protein n=1 Tax=Victivallis vadensis TaxID=172901 RepID=A0A848AQF1_9BACT|nr:DUF2924 domain-containing protein [Victivallis vadensis]NMD85241.1 DUF2924 domain-containing protein [Victivallis vadensis]HBP08596.1 DUF2924 domain-containing protein [Lentisphaeria bacterium]HCH84629.1 DUF2924 domain-containing protein [Lentisphaeria bacterium]
MRQQTPTSVTRQLMELQNMGVPALQARFEELYGFPTTQKRVVTLRKRIAFRIQELYYGGLTTAEKDVLNEVASNDPLANLQKTSNNESVLLPGSRLTRTWKGKEYEVTIMDDGRFEYEGRIFRSLSGIASEITGSHWNGKVFFGVK